MLRFITELCQQVFKGLFRSGSVINTATTVQMSELLVEDKQEEKEIGWFTTKNNLAMEFAYTPTPVYGSNFSDPDAQPIGWLMADGSIKTEKGHKMLRDVSEEEELWEAQADALSKHDREYLQSLQSKNTYEIPMFKFKPREVKNDQQ